MRRVHKFSTIQPHTKDVTTETAITKNRKTTLLTNKRITLSRHAVEVIAVVLAVVVPLSVQAGILLPLVNSEDESLTEEVLVSNESAIDVPVLSAAIHPDPQHGRGGGEVTVEEGALVSTGPVGADELATARKNQSGEISVYTVRVGDSLSEIAEMFGVTSNTILWANDISRATAIQPGDTLVILPVAGVRHVVKKGDTIAAIAKKYEGNLEEIIAYNQLDSGTELSVGDVLVVPGGALHTAPVNTAAVPSKSSSQTATKGSGLSHPAPGTIKTQGIHGYNAVDFGGSIGTAVRAAAAGEVIVSKSSGWNGGYGSYIVIKHSNGIQTLYAHLSSNTVGVGETVEVGTVIGAIGNTGKSTGPHLHFEVRGGKNPF